MRCTYCGRKNVVGYIEENAACKKCINEHIDNENLHPLTKRYLKYVNGDG